MSKAKTKTRVASRPRAQSKVSTAKLSTKIRSRDLPFVKDNSKGDRCFWNVAPTGDYGVDCEIGHNFALAYLEYLQTPNTTSLMPQILPEMPRKVTGIEVGFFTMVDHAAKAGSAAAFDLAAYWSRCHAEAHRKTKTAA
jgi:hypothetical protein